MIFVAVGTHHQPFDRLILAADRVATELDERVVIQRGPSRMPAPHAELVDALSPAAFAAHLAEARVVVLHAGSSSFLQARALGRRPIVVPRRPEHGEHVDDHQLRFAATLPVDEAEVVEPAALVDAIRRHTEPRPADAIAAADARTAAFCDRFGPLVDALVAGRRR
ncbi:MAG: glycosyltransferase [Myxococcota bacterium]